MRNELAFSKFAQEGLWSYTPMADSAFFTGDFNLTKVTTGMPVPNPPFHVLVYLNQTTDQ